MFQEPITKEVMQAMEDLLQEMNIDHKPKTKELGKVATGKKK